MDDKSLFSSHTLGDLMRRSNVNDENPVKEQKEVNDILFWWIAVYSYLKQKMSGLFDRSELDLPRFLD